MIHTELSLKERIDILYLHGDIERARRLEVKYFNKRPNETDLTSRELAYVLTDADLPEDLAYDVFSLGRTAEWATTGT